MTILPTGLSAGPTTVPTRLAQARDVVLGYDLGDRFLSESDSVADPAVTPEDRKALAEIHRQIETWNRYVIVRRPAHAQLVIAVRLGRRASAAGRLPGGGPGRTSGATSSVGVELSSPDDMLSVYEPGRGTFGTLLWRGQQRGGLSGSSPSLFEEFRSAVEGISPQP